MALLTGGYGWLASPLTGGLGARTPQTANPFNFVPTFFRDPTLGRHEDQDQDGMWEYTFCVPQAGNFFNSASAKIFAPEGLSLSPRSLGRLMAYAERLKPFTVGLTMLENRGQTYFEIQDERRNP